MTKLASRIATGIAILGLAAPAFAASTAKAATMTASVAKASVLHRTHKHKKVAATEKESKKPAKKNVNPERGARTGEEVDTHLHEEEEAGLDADLLLAHGPRGVLLMSVSAGEVWNVR